MLRTVSIGAIAAGVAASLGQGVRSMKDGTAHFSIHRMRPTA